MTEKLPELIQSEIATNMGIPSFYIITRKKPSMINHMERNNNFATYTKKQFNPNRHHVKGYSNDFTHYKTFDSSRRHEIHSLLPLTKRTYWSESINNLINGRSESYSKGLMYWSQRISRLMGNRTIDVQRMGAITPNVKKLAKPIQIDSKKVFHVKGELQPIRRIKCKERIRRSPNRTFKNEIISRCLGDFNIEIA